MITLRHRPEALFYNLSIDLRLNRMKHYYHFMASVGYSTCYHCCSELLSNILQAEMPIMGGEYTFSCYPVASYFLEE